MQIVLWVGFLLFVLLVIALDLGVFSRKSGVVDAKRAAIFTSVLCLLAGLFTLFVYFVYNNKLFGFGERLSGVDAAWQFLCGYFLELSLSLDNVFVIALILGYFKVPSKYQHRVLVWGILGALVLRGVMIGAGAAALQYISWTAYIFGGLLIYTAVKMLTVHEEVHPEHNPLVRFARKFYPVSSEFHGSRFFTTVEHRRTEDAEPVAVRAMTPLLLSVLVVETTDVLFAIDSIPAVFGVTRDTFIVFTSNVFAILGLRSLYFTLAALIGRLRYLKPCLAVLLIYIGGKMIVLQHFQIEAHAVFTIGPIFLILGVGVLLSIFSGPERGAATDPKVEAV